MLERGRDRERQKTHKKGGRRERILRTMRGTGHKKRHEHIMAAKEAKNRTRKATNKNTDNVQSEVNPKKVLKTPGRSMND
jgi:hypothetical protein